MDSEQENDTLTESNLEEIEEHISKFNGDEVVKKYLKGKFLGKGGFAKCYELKCVSNKKTYAGKIISKSNIIKPSAKNKLKSEIKIHKSLSHPNIVKFEHYFEDNENVYILLELCKSKTLNELLKKRKILSELEVKYYLFQILNAVKYMHKSKVIHRDLKLGNLFLSASLEIKIGDFGLATRVEYDGERKHTVCGTPNYIAPEILENKNSGHSYEVDYWAIGVIVYTLLIGRPPFETDDVKETYKKINANIYSFPPHVYISEIAKDFIQKILVTNPSNRLTPDMMLSHPFMNSTPIPKEMPHYTLSNPPKVDFFRGYEEENEKITSPNQLSFENDKEHLELLRNFALKNLKKCDDMNKGFIDLKSSHKYNKEADISDTKENHELLKKKVEDFDVNKAYNMLKDLKINPEDRLKSLSKGTKEKVQLILVMSREAKLYMLDEPIGGVDPAARDYILRTIISNYNPDASVIISTHLISDIEQVLDDVVFIKEGEVMLHKPVDEIREEDGKSVDELFREVFRC